MFAFSSSRDFGWKIKRIEIVASAFETNDIIDGKPALESSR